MRYVDPDGRSVDEAGKNCCPWPVSEDIGNFFGQIRDKVDSMLDFDINISLTKKDYGGFVMWVNGGFSKDGLAKPRKAKRGQNVENIDVTGFVAQGTSIGPNPKDKTLKGAGILLKSIILYNEKNGNGNDSNTSRSKTFEDYVPTGEMNYLSNNIPNSSGSYEIDSKLTEFEYSNSEDSLKIRQQNDQLSEYYLQKAYDKLDSILNKK